jgi:transposase
MDHYVGIDLHSNNSVIGIIDQNNKRILKKRSQNNLQSIYQCLEPYGDDIKAIIIESTFNWYWLADGLMEKGFNLHLANPSAIKQYEGLKQTDDTTDAFHLANLYRLGILPEGYIYPKQERPVRDLLRKRLMLVRQRTAQILSFQNLVARNRGVMMRADKIKTMNQSELETLFVDQYLILSARATLKTIYFLTGQIKVLEKIIKKHAKLKPQFNLLKTAPGIGQLLALTIMYETGDINRFCQPGHFTSYCRCVPSCRISNGKAKGSGNRKNGNRYLAWVFIEAANTASWHYDFVKRYYQKKFAKTNRAVAIKAVAHKLARACYYIMKDEVPFDPQKAFK